MIKSTREPVIICGCHGGGTSYVAKLLRWSGLFLGADAGPPADRKFHESRVFRRTNEGILQTLTGGCSLGMRTVDPGEWGRYFRGLEDPETFEAALRRIDARRIRRRYWGGNRLTTYLRRLRLRNTRWGWKDPRNSLTLDIWLRIFARPKVLVVTRKWVPGKSGKSGSGAWFNEMSIEEVRRIYMNPPALSRHSLDSFFFDFDDVERLDRMNALFRWIGFAPLDAAAHARLLSVTGFEWPQSLAPGGPESR